MAHIDRSRLFEGLTLLDSVERHKRQLELVRSWESVDDLPGPVQDQLAAAHGDTLPVVLAMYYGGTLGMVPDADGRLVPTDDAARLLEPLVLKGLDQKVRVIWVPVFEKAIPCTMGKKRRTRISNWSRRPLNTLRTTTASETPCIMALPPFTYCRRRSRRKRTMVPSGMANGPIRRCGRAS